MDGLSCILRTGCKFDIIGLSELWEPEDKVLLKKNYSIPDYHDFKFVSGKTKNSGCGLFIKDNLKYKVRDELNCTFYSNMEEFQIMFVEILLKSRNVLVCSLYRHPKGNSFLQFQNRLENILKQIKKENKKIIIIGDFNIDLLGYNTHPNTEFFKFHARNIHGIF